MYQNHYLELQAIGRIQQPYVGGFCKWWYTPIEFIASFPAVDPATQQLISEPVLQAGKTWYGPVNVPDKQVGWEEDGQRTKPGIYYKEKVTGYQAGQTAASHINLENLATHQVCIVGKVRAGGFYAIIGNDQAGLSLDINSTSGTGSQDAPGTKLAFTGESKNRALILPSFTGAITTLPPGTTAPPISGAPLPSTTRPMETIPFTNQSVINVPYNSTRRNLFGDFPIIEVWIDDGITRYLVQTQVEVDNPPPNQTAFTIKVAGPVSGFIILK